MKTKVEAVESRLPICKTARTRGTWSSVPLSRSPGSLSEHAQLSLLAMPTVSVKRDLLFQALGRTYSECRHRNLGTVALLGERDPPTHKKQNKTGIVITFMQPWPWAVVGRGVADGGSGRAGLM